MALTPGTRLGSYEIAARIGAGGMGEVYRATDTSLKRTVAIKVLPDLLATDADRLARLQREAEVLASLNHPNIAQIHGLERGPAEAGHYGQALSPSMKPWRSSDRLPTRWNRRMKDDQRPGRRRELTRALRG
jgi:serine/threonine protein kinase